MNLVYSRKIKEYNLREISDFLDFVFTKESVYSDAASRESVLLKPNLLSKPTKEINFVTTDKTVVEAAITLLLDHSVKSSKIAIGDGASAVHRNMDAIFEASGLAGLSSKYSIRLLNFNKSGYIERNAVKLTDFLSGNPYILNLAKLKTHMLTKLTLSVKNLYGLLPPEAKLAYHSQFNTEDLFCSLLARIYKAVSPDFSVVDGIVGMEGNGPGGGERTEPGIIACARNGFALDDFIGGAAGFKRGELLFINHGIKSKLYDGQFQVEGEYDQFRIKRPSRNSFTLPLSFARKKFARHLITSYPEVMNLKCMRCMKCMKMCPEKAIFLKDSFPFVRKRKCVACYCCVEVCPCKAIKTNKSFFERVISGK